MILKENLEIFVPSSLLDAKEAVAQTTDLCIAAHHDDIEIMAYAPIVECFASEEKWFSGVVVSDGAGSPRNGMYESFTDEQMKEVRFQEQKKAAILGNYSSQIFLGFKSSEIKDFSNDELVNELERILSLARPEILYTHNLADKHDTHVAVALRVIAAARRLPKEQRPKKMYALEVWRGLDWLCDKDKALFDTSPHPNLAMALLGVFDSQIAGGKRYDSAALGRRLSNATFFESHDTDSYESVSYGLDMTELLQDESLNPLDFITQYIKNFSDDVTEKIGRFVK